ncbi:MAG TPA: hypothetical protein PKC46_13350 [Sphingorhabdus sp.]|nr:hypothetical protein [Sphingorhabdus sp.]
MRGLGPYYSSGSAGGGGEVAAPIPVRGEIPAGVVDGTNPLFTLDFAPVAGVSLFYNGVRLGEDQFARVGVNITLSFNPETGASLRADYER